MGKTKTAKTIDLFILVVMSIIAIFTLETIMPMKIASYEQIVYRLFYAVWGIVIGHFISKL